MPGGADSNFRSWGEDTIYVDRGQGGLVWDLDGTEFVDLRMGYGPTILGHGDARVDEHVYDRMRRGVSFSLTSEDEISVAELICEMTFCDMARMTVSGTEATMHAIRVARGFTGRDRIVKFEGQYHGVHDYALISVLPADVTHLGDRDEPVRLAWGRGIPEAIKETVIPAVYNDLDGLRRIFEREGDHIAAVIIEPILGNAQGILPQQGFLDGVRRMTREFGSLLIFDEVKTGFRVARGGAAELFGITPDLATYAKAMGNGYPAAAFGGRRDVMAMLPKHVSHGGTYAGNRVAAAAANKVLSIIRDTDALDTVARNGLAMQAGIGAAIERRGLPHVFTGVPADVRHHVRRAVAGRLSRLGGHRPRALRRGGTRHVPAWCHAGARFTGALVPVRGARGGRPRRPRHLGVRGLARRGPRGAHPQLARPLARGVTAAREPACRLPTNDVTTRSTRGLAWADERTAAADQSRAR